MNNPINIVFSNLTDFYYTMKLRKEAYEHAFQLQSFSDEDKLVFNECIKDSEKSIMKLSDQLDDISSHMHELSKEEGPPLRCSFYYAMAKSTSMVTTVCLSLQLGDTWFMKNFEELLMRHEFTHLQKIKKDMKSSLDCIKSSVQNELYMRNVMLGA